MPELPNGNGLLKYANVVSTLGVPVVISLFMVWWITNLIGKDMHEAQADRRQIIELIRDQNRQMDSNFQVYGGLLYLICVQSVKGDLQICNQQQLTPQRPFTPPKER
jgi:hypothetical protein